MGKKDSRVDQYIARSGDFAKPILTKLRTLVHTGCPDVEETIKWGVPHFEYKGMLCSMAAFKAHCNFGFWKGTLLKDSGRLLGQVGKTSMGYMDRITDVSQLPGERAIFSLIKEAARLNDEGVKVVRPTKPKKKSALTVPDSFMKALRRNKDALKSFESFSPTNKREYVEWVMEAKTDATRERRLETAVEWMSEGKARNWKYTKK